MRLFETLVSIARYWYGDEARAADIFDANRDVLDTPSPLPIDELIRIPMIDAELPPLR